MLDVLDVLGVSITAPIRVEKIEVVFHATIEAK